MTTAPTTTQFPPRGVGWLDTDRLKAIDGDFDTLTVADITTIAKEATWVLDQLTEGRFHGIECWADQYELTGCKVRIRGPLREVETVQRIHDVCGARTRTDIDNWCLVGPSTLSVCGCADQYDFRTNFGGACGCRKRIRVTYSTKANLPPGAANTVDYLAREYAKARTGQKCNLPERITQVSRQGVSWSILDPLSFLEKGMTGMGRVDSWLATAKRSGGGRVIDPTLGRRISTKRVTDGPCGDPFAGSFNTGFDHPGGVR